MTSAAHPPDAGSPAAPPVSDGSPPGAQSPDRPRKPNAIGCVFADQRVEIAERSAEDYAAYLEEL